MTNIYFIYDPRDPLMLPWYVGKGLQKRAESHWKFFLRKGQAVNVLLRYWFEKLKAEGIEPAWRFLEENVENWQEAEKAWVVSCRVINPDLCNIADGGNEVPDTESRRRGNRIGGQIGGRRSHELHPDLAIKNGRKMKHHTEEAKIKIGLKRRGSHHTDEAKDKIRRARLGKHFSQETKIKIGLAGRGRQPWNKGKIDVCSKRAWLNNG